MGIKDQYQWKEVRRELRMRKIIGYLGIVIILVLIALGINDYFITSINETGQLVDGFGRPLYPGPPIMKLLGNSDWAGLRWFIVDTIIFWPSFILAIYMIVFGFKTRDKEGSSG